MEGEGQSHFCQLRKTGPGSPSAFIDKEVGDFSLLLGKCRNPGYLWESPLLAHCIGREGVFYYCCSCGHHWHRGWISPLPLSDGKNLVSLGMLWHCPSRGLWVWVCAPLLSFRGGSPGFLVFLYLRCGTQGAFYGLFWYFYCCIGISHISHTSVEI